MEEIVLAHPKKVKAIAAARIKNDKIDARTLAELLRVNLLPAAYTPPQWIRDTRDLVRHRAHLVRQRTRLKNRIHAVLARYGLKKPQGGLFSKKGKAFLQSVAVRVHHRHVLDDSLFLLEQFTARIKVLDRLIAEEVANNPMASLLKTLPGVGPYSALVLTVEIGAIDRFPSPKHLCSYAGLVPSTHSSGGHTRHGRITKEGSPWLRWNMIEAAQSVAHWSPTFRHYRDRIAAKHGRNTAKGAVARKMLTAAFWMVQRNEPFREAAVV